MGSIHVESMPGQEGLGIREVDVPLIRQTNGDGFRSFKVMGLEADQISSTGMRDEILLLSWLIVLLRTREDSEVCYNWAYKSRDGVVEGEPVNRRLVTDDIVPGRQSTVGQVAAKISRHTSVATSTPCTSTSGPASLLLSTGSFSQTSEGVKDESTIHLEICFDNSCLEIRPVWHSDGIPQFTVRRYVETLVDTIKICLSNPDASIEDCLGPTTHDLDQIWGWNHLLPPTYDFCMHDVISERAQTCPDKLAISSWDGSLSYSQIDRYSTFLACSLRESGVEFNDFLPVCFEKSRWTIVAVLAVMKAGATMVLMDPTLPLARLQNMAEQVSAKAMLSSCKQQDRSTSIMPDGKLFVVGAETFASLLDSQVLSKVPIVPPSTLMYIIFTSGSTGTPKGVQISHQTYTSSAIPRARAVGYTEDSRVLDFASYAFDVSIDSMLLTLANGGCLCIPSDEDRLNDINGVIRNMQVNYAGITPSMARILDLDVIASLSGLGLGGEAASARDVALWGQYTRIIIGYGPCECTIGCTVNSSAAKGTDYLTIGPGNGAAIWIVDPNDHESLMPVGAVGELLVEGPIVGQGYLNDPEKTAAAFIRDPAWLTAGHNGYPGRQGRLYKTGDLGLYDPDGCGEIVFVGRKDTQVKLRGQRVELGEIESQLTARLPPETSVIAEVIVPLGSGGQPTLVAFIAPQSKKGHELVDIESTQLAGELREMLSKAEADLANVLPRYMVPTAYIPVNHIPTLISGKTDRKRLRQFGTTVDLRQLDQASTSTTEDRQLNDMEQRLRQAWSQILKLEPDAIRLEDNFFALGGDSLAAMKLVSLCREGELELSVTSTFDNPTLSAMAGTVRICDSQARMDRPAFCMIPQPVESASIEASQACGSEPTDIEDIYPCTATQESLFTFSMKSTQAYVAQRVACIPSHISLDDWKKAWEVVIAASPILRTRLVQLHDSPGLRQVVLKESILWRDSTDLAQYLENDRNEAMDLGQSLARYAIVEDTDSGKRYMVWTLHHALYDGWSEPLVLEKVRDALQSQRIETQADMGSFVKYVRDTDEVALQEFWRRELQGAVGPQFPRLPSRDFLPAPDTILEHHIPLETTTGLPFTLATLIRGAWALVSSQYSGGDDVVFGETITGRDIPLPGVEGIVGPLIATLPIRVRIDRTVSVASYLQSVQQGISARTPYQHMGMQNIRKVSRDAQYACEAPSGLIIQPEPEYVGGELGFSQGDVVMEAIHFNPYSLMLACGIQKGGFRVCASFDSNLIEVAQMERILAQLETVCSQLTKDLSQTIDKISCLPEAELNQIWSWNQDPPLRLDESPRRLRADANIKQGSMYPRAAVPWVCNPRNPSLLSAIGCAGELWLEGAFFSGETIESPAWLVAGSSKCVGRTGRLQPTGDIVELREDGSLVFVGRKENVVPVQGHAVATADLEVHFTKYLPPPIRAAATVFQALPDKTQEDSGQELVIFIEQQTSEDDGVEIMSVKHDLSCASDSQTFETTICATVSTSLAMAIRRLDKFIQNSLASNLAPSAYIVIDKMPTKTEEVDHSLLQQLASRIPRHILDQLREGFKEAWTKTSTEPKMTIAESTLRSSWAKILGLSPEQIDVDDNFFRLGGDSVLAMKLVSDLRMQGHKLTVADIFRHMRLGDAAKVLKVNQVSKQETVQPYKPFSMLDSSDRETFLSEVVGPKLANPLWTIQDVYPVTDSQELDIRATIQAPRTSIQYTMLYFNDQGIDRKKLLQACQELVKTHDILRSVFIKHESIFLQVVLRWLDVPVTTQRADKDLEQFVTDLCTAQAESEFQLGSSFLQIFHVEGNDGRECLVIGLSHAQYDGMSLPRLLRDLETLYTGGKMTEFEPFSSYMSRICEEGVQTKAVNYWSKLLDGSSLVSLDGVSAQSQQKAMFKTTPVEVSQPPRDITMASLLNAAWALVLARRLRTPDVTFGSITSGRSIDLANVENVMGPCYQFTPIRVPFQPQWTAMDLLQFVQRQTAESSAYDFLGFDKISKQCTQWSSEGRFFDSIVHHQDWEDFDAMPFAEGSCRVEILAPHGDASSPIKAVSFLKDGQMQVGIVGSETDSAFVDSVLGELAGAVQELVSLRAEHVMLDGQIF